MSRRLTDKQRELYQFVVEFRSSNGYSPSLGEMAERLKISHQGASCHLAAIIKKGLLVKSPGKSRSVIPALQLTKIQLDHKTTCNNSSARPD